MKALVAMGALILYGARCYTRQADGFHSLTPQPVLPGGTNDEAIDELNERLPADYCALLAHVGETDPSRVDDVLRSSGGVLFRRSVDDVEASAFHRFLYAASM